MDHFKRSARSLHYLMYCAHITQRARSTPRAREENEVGHFDERALRQHISVYGRSVTTSGKRRREKRETARRSLLLMRALWPRYKHSFSLLHQDPHLGMLQRLFSRTLQAFLYTITGKKILLLYKQNAW
jgi:hypothetical protein